MNCVPNYVALALMYSESTRETSFALNFYSYRRFCILGGVAVTTENNFLPAYEKNSVSCQRQMQREKMTSITIQEFCQLAGSVSPTNSSTCLSSLVQTGVKLRQSLPFRRLMPRMKMAQRHISPFVLLTTVSLVT